MRIRLFFLTFSLLLLPGAALAQTFGAIGPRAEGMGGAFVAVADDATAAYWNPAGLATGALFDLQVSVAEGSTVFVGAGLPMLGISYYRTHQEVRLPTVSPSSDRHNGGSGEVRTAPLTTSNTGVTLVQTIAPGLVIGATTRVVAGGVEGADSRTTLDVDAGVMVSAWDVRFGLTARNLRQPEFAAGPEGAPGDAAGTLRLDRQVRAGAAFAPRSAQAGAYGPYTVAIDADLTTTPGPFGDRRGAAVGGEYWLAQGLVGVRGGVRWSTLGDADGAFSGGVTVRLPGSLYVEGQLTKIKDVDERQWTVGARITF
jgi:hypothetical protein